MKNTDLLKKFKNLFPKLYSFSYTIIQDDLQATQITIDAFTGYSWEEKDQIEELMDSLDYGETQRAIFNMELALYKIIYQLAIKRDKQLNIESEKSGQNRAFFSLPILDRALLFLKYKTVLEIEDIETILNLKRHEVINYLNLAKRSFLNSSNPFAQENRL